MHNLNFFFQIQKHFSNIVFAYFAHVKFQKASFNSNRDMKQNVGLDGGDGGDGRDGGYGGYGDGPQNNTSRRFSKTGGK